MNDETQDQLSELAPAEINEDTVIPQTVMSGGEAQALRSARITAKNMRQKTREYLEAQPKVSVFIPDTADEYVAINGYAYLLKRGEQVDVPKPIAELLHNKWRALNRSNRENIVRNHGTV